MKTHCLHFALCVIALVGGFSGCSNADDEPDLAALRDEATLGVKDYVDSELQKLLKATEALQDAAPEPDADGWNAEDDEDAVADMRASWSDARDAYERVEGSIAVLFGELDVSTDERYDGFLEVEPDEDLFDAEGVTGMHAIERILWAGEHPKNVIDFESSLDGYQVAAFPKTEAQAEGFKTKLAQLLVDDVETMIEDFEPVALQPNTAFGGMIGSMAEQLEKVQLAATAGDESRYAQRTLDDMRANLEGGEAVYEAFRPWILEASGEEVDEKIAEGFSKLAAAYAKNEGPAIPPVPDTFDPLEPSDADLQTDYGKLYKLLTDETDVDEPDSLLNVMTKAADDMGIELIEE
jgi:iron uptake system component EfeO